LLDWFEVDLGFTELLFIQIDLCVMCVFAYDNTHTHAYDNTHTHAGIVQHGIYEVVTLHYTGSERRRIPADNAGVYTYIYMYIYNINIYT